MAAVPMEKGLNMIAFCLAQDPLITGGGTGSDIYDGFWKGNTIEAAFPHLRWKDVRDLWERASIHEKEEARNASCLESESLQLFLRDRLGSGLRGRRCRSSTGDAPMTSDDAMEMEEKESQPTRKQSSRKRKSVVQLMMGATKLGTYSSQGMWIAKGHVVVVNSDGWEGYTFKVESEGSSDGLIPLKCIEV